MKDSVVHDAKLNAVSYYVNFGVNAILNLIISPILLKYFGVSDFGVWKTCQKFLDFASVADGRGSQALKWIIARDKNNNDYDYKKRCIGSAVLVWIVFFPILLIAFSVLIYFLPSVIKNIQIEDYSKIRWIGFILSINILLASLLGIPDAVLIGSNKGRKSINPQTFWFVIANLAMVYFAMNNYKLSILPIVVATATAISGVTVYFMATKNIKWWGVSKPSSAEKKLFLGFSSWVLAWSFVEKIFLSLELILISSLIGSIAAAQYTFTSYIAQVAIAISLLTGSSIMPGLGGIIGSGDKKRAAEIIIVSREIFLGISIFFAAYIVIFNGWFVRLWAGERLYLGEWENILMAILLVQTIHIRNESQYQDLTLDIKLKVVSGISTTIFSIVLAFLGQKFYPNSIIIAILIALIFARLPLNFILPISFNKKNDITQNNGLKFVIALLLFMIFCAGGFLPQKNSWMIFFLECAVAFPVIITIIYLFLLTPLSRNFIKQKISKKYEK